MSSCSTVGFVDVDHQKDSPKNETLQIIIECCLFVRWNFNQVISYGGSMQLRQFCNTVLTDDGGKVLLPHAPVGSYRNVSTEHNMLKRLPSKATLSWTDPSWRFVENFHPLTRRSNCNSNVVGSPRKVRSRTGSQTSVPCLIASRDNTTCPPSNKSTIFRRCKKRSVFLSILSEIRPSLWRAEEHTWNACSIVMVSALIEGSHSPSSSLSMSMSIKGATSMVGFTSRLKTFHCVRLKKKHYVFLKKIQ